MWPHFVDLLEKANIEYPDRVFIHFPEAPGFLTYGEAYAWAQQKVLAFQREGVKSGERVGICLPQGPELVITLLALQCMGVSIFLFDSEKVHKLFNHRDDPEWLRLKSVIQGCQFSCIVSQKAEAVEQLLKTLGMDTLPKTILIKSKNIRVHPKNPFPSLERDKNAEAYVVTSSGSTAEPKLIAINGHVLNFCGEFGEKLQAFSKKNYEQEQLNAALDIPLSFDPFLFLIYVMLSSGGSVTIPLLEEKIHLNQIYDYYPRLYDYYKSKGVNLMVRLPTALSLHGKYLQSSYKHTPLMMLSTGEELTPERLAQFFKSIPHHQMSVFNCWGPSEGGIGSTLSLVTEKEVQCSIFQKEFSLKSRRLGLITLKDNNNPRELITTPGIKGEICWQNPLGDEFLGYIGREDLTKEKSIEVEGERWITSGDVGYFSERGEWYFHKRLDSVKHAGKKMELTGIKESLQDLLQENQITQWELLLTKKEPQWILVAYSAGNPTLTQEKLFKRIQEKNPETSGLYLMDYSYHWPINANGKFNGKKVESDFMEKIKDTTKSYRETLIFYLQLFLTKTISEKTLLDRTFEELGMDSVSYKLFMNGLYDHPRFQPWPHLPAADNPQCYYEKTGSFVDIVVEAFELLENVEMLGDERAEITIIAECNDEYLEESIKTNSFPISILHTQKSIEEQKIFWRVVELKKPEFPYLLLSDTPAEELDTWKIMHKWKTSYGYYMENSISKLIKRFYQFTEIQEQEQCWKKLALLQERYRHWSDVVIVDEISVKGNYPITFHYGNGRILCIKGLAGSGKTTVLKQLIYDNLSRYTHYIVDKMTLEEDAIEASMRRDGFSKTQIALMKEKENLFIVIEDVDIVRTPLDDLLLPPKLLEDWPHARFIVTLRGGSEAIQYILHTNEEKGYYDGYIPHDSEWWLQQAYKNKNENVVIKTLGSISCCDLADDYGYKWRELGFHSEKTFLEYEKDIFEISRGNEIFLSKEELRYLSRVNFNIMHWAMEYYIHNSTATWSESFSFIAERWLTKEVRRYQRIFPSLTTNSYSLVRQYAKKLCELDLSRAQVKISYHRSAPGWDRSDKSDAVKEYVGKIKSNSLDHFIPENYYAFQCCPLFNNMTLLKSIAEGKEYGNTSIDINSFCHNSEAVRYYHPDATGVPLFFLPPVTGEDVVGRTALSTAFAGHPIYVFQHPGYAEQKYIELSLKEQVNYYVCLLETLYPEGDILLMGYSFGGLMVALMAEALEKRGRTVLFVGVIDGRNPRLWREMPEDAFLEILKARLRWIGERLYVALKSLNAYEEELEHFDSRYKGLDKIEAAKKLKVFFENLLIDNEAYLTSNNEEEYKQKSRKIAISTHNLICLYEDSTEIKNLHGNAYLYKSTQNDPLYPIESDPSIGWMNLQEARIKTIDGSTHFSLLKDHCYELCQALERNLHQFLESAAILRYKTTHEAYAKQLEQQKPADYIEFKHNTETATESISDVFHAFSQSQKKCFILYGESGMGKSYHIQHFLAGRISDFLAQHYYLFYLTIENDFLRDVEKSLRLAGYAFTHVESMMKTHKMMFIIDGFDEMPWRVDYFNHPLLKNHNIKIFISCRSDEENKHRLEKLLEPLSLSEQSTKIVTLVKLTQVEKEHYIKRYAENNKTFFYEKAMKTFNREDIYPYMDTLLYIWIFCESFKVMIEKHPLQRYSMTDFYEYFLQPQNKLEPTYSLTTLNLSYIALEFCRQLAEKVLYPEENQDREDLSPSNFIHQYCAKVSPVRESWGKYEFIHRQFAEFYMAFSFTVGLLKINSESKYGFYLLKKYDIKKYPKILHYIPHICIMAKHMLEEITFIVYDAKDTTEVFLRNANFLECQLGLRFIAKRVFTEPRLPIVKERNFSQVLPSLLFNRFVPLEVDGECNDETPSQVYEKHHLMRCGNKLVTQYSRQVIHEFNEVSNIYLSHDMKYYYTIKFTDLRDEGILLINQYSFLNNSLIKKEGFILVKNIFPSDVVFNVLCLEKNIAIFSSHFGLFYVDKDLSKHRIISPDELKKTFGENNLPDELYDIYDGDFSSYSFYAFFLKKDIKNHLVNVFKINKGSYNWLEGKCQFPQGIPTIVKKCISQKTRSLVEDDIHYTMDDNFNIKGVRIFNIFSPTFQSFSSPNFLVSTMDSFTIKSTWSDRSSEKILFNNFFISSSNFHTPMGYFSFSYAPLNAVIKNAYTLGSELIIYFDTSEGSCTLLFSLLTLASNYMLGKTASPKGYFNENARDIQLYPLVYHPYFHPNMLNNKRYGGVHIPEKFFWLNYYCFLRLSQTTTELMQIKNHESVVDASLLEKLQKTICAYNGLLFSDKIRSLKIITCSILSGQENPNKVVDLLLWLEANGTPILEQLLSGVVSKEKSDELLRSISYYEIHESPLLRELLVDEELKVEYKESLDKLCNELSQSFEAEVLSVSDEGFTAFYQKAKEYERERNLSLFEDRLSKVSQFNSTKAATEIGLFSHRRSLSATDTSTLQKPEIHSPRRRNSFS